MSITNWIIGPQLIGIIFLITGLITARFPPKKINPLYGFKTILSMENQQNWDVANRYAPRYMIKCGLILIVAGVLIAIGLQTLTITDKTKAFITTSLLLGSAIGSSVSMIVATDKHIAKTIDNPID